jgi:hypothetical protein
MAQSRRPLEFGDCDEEMTNDRNTPCEDVLRNTFINQIDGLSVSRKSSRGTVCRGTPQTAKDGASRRYLAGVPLPTLMLELGHESLAVTQDYLADVRKPGEAKRAVSDADFIPKPNIVKTGTHGD